MEKGLSKEERWKKAESMQKFYNSNYGTNISKSAFYKNDNPLTQRLMRYDVTYVMHHRGNNSKLGGSYEFFIPQDTFSIYVLSDVETENELQERTKSQIADIFRGNARDWVYNKTEVNVIRGVEKNSVEYNEVNLNEISTSQNSRQTIRKRIVVESRRGKSSSSNDYDLDIWL